MSEIKFTINGKPYSVSSLETNTTLNNFLRNHAELRGTKFMCNEGGCGSCVVSVSNMHPVTKMTQIFSVNSCLVSILSCHGWAITTIEGIGDKKNGYHLVQKRLAAFNGSQCGFCSPGFVMNMYSLLEGKKDGMTMKEVENSFASNICRCTGYRPICDAFKSFAKDVDPELMKKIQDIEDLSSASLCKKTGSICNKTCNDYSKEGEFCMIDAEMPMEYLGMQTVPIVLSEGNHSKWFKVYNIQDIFNIFDKEGTDSYKLVAGNTAQGVYDFKERYVDEPRIMIDISSVAELREHSLDANLVLGGNMTLAEMMDLFVEISSTNELFYYTMQMYKHMDLVAHVPIRNIGTIAGNLSIKHKNIYFPSDVFIIFEAVGASVKIAERDGKFTIVTLPEYLKLNMAGKIIHSIHLPPISSDYSFVSYKIMPRIQHSHAIINAGFLLKMTSDGDVERARIVYGGINPEFIHASETEKLLIDKNIFKNEVLKEALQSLSKELLTDHNAPEPSPEYRKQLAIGLFYKCILNLCPPNILNELYVSGGHEFDRSVSSGKQDYETRKEVWPLNKPMPKIEALVQTSGEAKYCNDMPKIPDEVFAAFVLSNVHNGEIDEIDMKDALNLKGVVALFTAKDIPGENNFTPLLPMLVNDKEEILCSGAVKYYGQPVAIVVAETDRLANIAATQVKVTYKNSEKKEPLLTVRDVLKDPSSKERIVNISTIEPKEKGNDVEKVIKGSLDIFGQYHYTMETLSCVCVPVEDGLDVFSSSQWIDWTQVAIAEMLKIPENSINIKVRRIGGGYGSKVTRSIQVSTACALVAHILQRPTRFVLSIEASMSAIGKRFPCSSDYEVGVNADGKIQYLKNIFYEDAGCSHNENAVINEAIHSFGNGYDEKTWYISANSLLTDTPSNTWCRAPGTTEGVAMIEHIMDHIATEVSKDPVEVRLINMSTEDNLLPDLIKKIKESSGFTERREKINTYNKQNRWRKRGISLIPMKYHLTYFGNFSAHISIYHGDGSVAVSHAGVEMGQGINTKVAQVCAYTLGIPLESVSVKPTTDFVTPNSPPSGGSITSETCCLAAMKACQILLERLEPIKKTMENPSWKDLIGKAFLSQVNLTASYKSSFDELKNYIIWGAAVTEVEVDMLTGNYYVLRVDILEDTGESLSPDIDVGQIEGSYVMGLGYWTSEHLVYDKKTGALLSNRTWTYKTPGIKDIPIDFRVQFLHNSPNPLGVLRSKATGEPAINMSFGIVLAIRHALMSVRVDNGFPSDQWFHLDLPATPEHVILASETKIDQFQL